MKQAGLAILAVAIPFLVPLALTPHLLFYYDITPKVALLMLAAALGLALAFQQLDSLISFWRRPTGRWFCVAAISSILISGISTLRSAERDLSWYGSNWRRLGTLTECAVVLAAFWIALYASRSQRRLTLLLRSICAAGLLASLYGIAQYFAWDPVLPAAAYEAGEGIFRIVRPPSTLGHSDYFSAFLLWPVFAGAALIAFERSPAWRLLAISTTIAVPVAILLSGSRGALLGLVAGAVIHMLLVRPRPRSIGGVVLIAAVLLTGFYMSPAGGRLRARVHWVEEEPAGGARLLLWRDSLRLAAAHPVIGAGADAFVAEFPKFQSVELARAYPDFFHESPHNLLLDTLANQGALGLLALLAVAAAGIAGGIRARKLSPLSALALLPGLIATLIVHQFAVFIAPTAFYFYLAAGTLAGARADDVAPPLGALVAEGIPNLWRYAVLAAGIPCAVFFSLAAYQLLAEDLALAQVQRHLDLGNASAAAEAYRRALNRPSAGVSADLYLSRRWSQIAMSSSQAMPRIYFSQVAAGAASRATHQPEQLPNAWYNLSILLAARNDTAGVEYSLRSAIAAAPNWYKPHWTLARVLAAQGRGPEAALEANRAVELNGGKDAEVASTLAEVLRSGGSQP